MQTQERRDRIEDAEQSAYDEAYNRIEGGMRDEYEAEFGEKYRAKYPFKADGALVHRLVMKELNERRNDD